MKCCCCAGSGTKRHHKRRLIQPPFVELIASRLRAGGVFGWRRTGRVRGTDAQCWAQRALFANLRPAVTGCRGQRTRADKI
jgi:hypothetical protein